jgi:hypothetical protein
MVLSRLHAQPPIEPIAGGNGRGLAGLAVIPFAEAFELHDGKWR